jgi:peroxiredoxin
MKLLSALLLFSLTSLAQTPAKVTGDWTGSATSHGQQVPIHLRITGTAKSLNAALINGPESSPATGVSVDGNHLLVKFNYYDKTLDATIADGTLTGSYGTKTVRYPLTMSKAPVQVVKGSVAPKIDGDWEVAVKSAKGESAWQLRVAQTGQNVKAVIQRIDGDTGSLYGTWDQPAPGMAAPSHTYRVSHFTAAGPALYTLTPKEDGTLILTNLLRADLNPPDQQNLVARRPEAARAAKLAPPTDPTQQTTMKDPTKRFVFSAPDLAGKVVSNTDRQFDGKVVIVTVGGSWCPNCHDEAPFLESLYKQFHAKGLEIVNLSFEEDEDQLKDPVRLRAFIARYHLDYTVLLAGTTDQLNEKIPDAEHLNSWPTSFILGRDGRVKQVHAGFAGPANPEAHEELVKEMTALIGELLAEPVPTQNASLTR